VTSIFIFFGWLKIDHALSILKKTLPAIILLFVLLIPLLSHNSIAADMASSQTKSLMVVTSDPIIDQLNRLVPGNLFGQSTSGAAFGAIAQISKTISIFLYFIFGIMALAQLFDRIIESAIDPDSKKMTLFSRPFLRLSLGLILLLPLSNGWSLAQKMVVNFAVKPGIYLADSAINMIGTSSIASSNSPTGGFVMTPDYGDAVKGLFRLTMCKAWNDYNSKIRDLASEAGSPSYQEIFSGGAESIANAGMASLIVQDNKDGTTSFFYTDNSSKTADCGSFVYKASDTNTAIIANHVKALTTIAQNSNPFLDRYSGRLPLVLPKITSLVSTNRVTSILLLWLKLKMPQKPIV
jgi:conjugal transfer/type IV secretion protein DotA/TraY